MLIGNGIAGLPIDSRVEDDRIFMASPIELSRTNGDENVKTGSKMDVSCQSELPGTGAGGELLAEGEPPNGVNQVAALQRWNTPRINTFRYLSTLFSFVVMGMNDGAYGVCYPQNMYNSASLKEGLRDSRR